MKLEVGKSYRTKNGMVAEINYNTDDMGYPKHIYPFGGIIKGRGAAFFTEGGLYNINNTDSEFNIVEEIPLR